MTQTPVTAPPVKVESVAVRPSVVGLHLGEPFYNVCYGRMMPLDFPFATQVLSRALTLALSQDLLLEDGEITVFGTLRDGIGLAFTHEPRRTIATLQAELATLQLLPMCQIGIKTPDGWQCVFPGAQVPMDALMDLQRVQAVYERQQTVIDQNVVALLKLLELHRPRPGHPGDCPPSPAQ